MSCLESVRSLLAKWTEVSNRSIICSPNFANHGWVSGWMISVSGSPPRAEIYFDDNAATLLTPELKKLGMHDSLLLHRFREQHLKRMNERVSFP